MDSKKQEKRKWHLFDFRMMWYDIQEASQLHSNREWSVW